MDDHKGRWHLFDTAAQDAILFSQDGSTFLVPNAPGARLVRFDAATLERVEEIPVGAGIVALARRPGTDEVWCVDHVTSSVTVVDESERTVVRTIRVGAQPSDIAFSATGDRAWVSCSGIDRIDVVTTADYARAASIPVPVRGPRALERVGDLVWVAPRLSGNGSAPRGNAASGDALDVRRVVQVEVFDRAVPLPDRDLVAIRVGASAAEDALDASVTRKGLGTILYDVVRRPGTSELWIPHTDALNARKRGEKSFLEGQVVRNRIAVVDLAGGVRWIDLDALAPEPAERCSTPTCVTFSADGNRAYVVGYGASRVAVLDLEGADVAWAGTIDVLQRRTEPSVALLPGHSGAGPRCAALSPDGSELLVLNSGENSLSVIPLALLPGAPGFHIQAPAPLSLGHDPTPALIVQGRIDFNRTDNSRSKTSACASCHVDGHVDGLAWDLGTFFDGEYTAPDSLRFPVDPKGPLVTQSTRRLAETGPWHWRGERGALREFDHTFVTLLERQDGGETTGLGLEFNYLERYVRELSLHANPRQEPDRRYTPLQLEGAALFHERREPGGLACADCHPLPLGTSGEVAANGRGGLAPTTVVPSLRGVAEKLTPAYEIGEAFGTRTELGAGLGHAGAFASLEAFLSQPGEAGSGHAFDLPPGEITRLTAFLAAFDTGLAPAAAWQATLHAGDAGGAELDFLLDEARRGHCDVIFRYGPVTTPGAGEHWPGGLFDPALELFRTASAGAPLVDPAELRGLAAGGTPVTLYGVPLWAGWPMGIDRDGDKLLDLDERELGTDPEGEDTDGDGFPDGYEVAHGLDPLLPGAASPDEEAPRVVEGPDLVYATQNTLKVELATDEPVRGHVRVGGVLQPLRIPIRPRFDDRHSIVLAGLAPGTTHSIEIHLKDPAGNAHVEAFQAATRAPVLPAPVHVESIEMQLPANVQGVERAHVTVQLARAGSAPAPLGYNLTGALYHRSGTATVQVGGALQTWLAHPLGRAHFWIDLEGAPAPGSGELTFVLLGVTPPPGAPAHVLADDRVRQATRAY